MLHSELGVGVPTFNSLHSGRRGRKTLEFETSLVRIVSYKMARAT